MCSKTSGNNGNATSRSPKIMPSVCTTLDHHDADVDNLPLESSVNHETMVGLVHIAVCVSFQNSSADSEDTQDYYENYGCYTKALSSI